MSKLLNFLNDMPPRQILILSGGVAVAMFAVIFFALTFLTDSKKAEEEITVNNSVSEMTNVVTAVSDISPRTMIKENMVKLKEVPIDMIPEGAVTNVSEILNTSAKVAIFAGDILTDHKIYKNMDQAGFVGSIPPNCRAVSIDVNSVTGVDGFAKPGDYVDLLLVEKNNKTVITNVLLQNILLLSINQNMSDSKGDGENSNTTAIDNPSIATLALKPDEAMRLISATKLGEIYLMLRPFKPTDMYVDEFAVQNSVETPPPQAASSIQNFNPAVNSNVPFPVTNLPVNSNTAANVKNNVSTSRIEIIQGDKVSQNAK